MARIWAATYKNLTSDKCAVQSGTNEEVLIHKLSKIQVYGEVMKMSDLQDNSILNSSNSTSLASLNYIEPQTSAGEALVLPNTTESLLKPTNTETTSSLIKDIFAGVQRKVSFKRTTTKQTTKTTNNSATHFIELNNSRYDTTTSKTANRKLIKVKIIVPKGTLNNSKFDHRSNVLSIINDFDKNAFNNSDQVKITNLLKTSELATSTEEVLLNRETGNVRNYPVMGKNALLAKTNSVKNCQLANLKDSGKQGLSDSAIIQELVTERYQDFMIDYYQRNYKRQTSRRSSTQTSASFEMEKENEKEINASFISNIKHSSTVNEPQEILDNLSIQLSVQQLENLSIQQFDDHLSNKQLDGESTAAALLILENESGSQREIGLSRQDLRSLLTEESFSDFKLEQDVTLGSALNFILSTDLNNVETTEELQEGSSLGTLSNDTPHSKVEYDAQRFLQVALGEELNLYVSTDSQMETTSDENNDTTKSSAGSVGTSDISALLSKASSLYSTVSNKIRRLDRKLPPAQVIDEEEDTLDQTYYDECYPVAERTSNLMRESIVQYQIMMQTSKALTFCNSTKEFVGSGEQVEAERMLLLASCKRDAILDAIKKLDYDEVPTIDFHSRGSVKLSTFTFFPKESSPKSSHHHHHHSSPGHRNRLGEFTQWFLCLVNCNEYTYATEAQLADEEGFVRFNEEFHFEDLATDFDVHISVYAMKVKNNMRNYSHESKYHLNKDFKTKCPATPVKFLHLSKDPSKPKHSPTNDNYHHKQSSFTLWGRTTLRLANISPISGPYRMTKVPLQATLSGHFTVDVVSNVRLLDRYAGFLNVGREAVMTTKKIVTSESSSNNNGGMITWNRHWCALVEGGKLHYWNYPTDEGVVEPLGEVDLACCVTARIAAVDRMICARARTLLVETTMLPENNVATRRISYTSTGKANYTIVRNFLAADTLNDMHVWQDKLNHVVSTLRNWNSMKCQLYFKRE